MAACLSRAAAPSCDAFRAVLSRPGRGRSLWVIAGASNCAETLTTGFDPQRAFGQLTSAPVSPAAPTGVTHQLAWLQLQVRLQSLTIHRERHRWSSTWQAALPYRHGTQIGWQIRHGVIRHGCKHGRPTLLRSLLAPQGCSPNQRPPSTCTVIRGIWFRAGRRMSGSWAEPMTEFDP